jgi:hypothetical protein
LVVLTHHQTTGTLAAATWEADLAEDELEGARDLIDPGRLLERSFARRWAFRRDIASRVIVTNLADVRFERENHAADAQAWRVSLTWRGDQTDAGRDGADRADRGSVVVPLSSVRVAERTQEGEQ